jgi:hypothetical protein
MSTQDALPRHVLRRLLGGGRSDGWCTSLQQESSGNRLGGCRAGGAASPKEAHHAPGFVESSFACFDHGRQLLLQRFALLIEFVVVDEAGGIGSTCVSSHVLDQRPNLDHDLRPVGDHIDISNEILDTVISRAQADERTEVDVRAPGERRRPKFVIDDLIAEAVDLLMVRIEEGAQRLPSDFKAGNATAFPAR